MMDFPQHTTAALFPYYALPHTGMWRKELLRLRLLGCQAVVLPVLWAYHSPAQGYHDFSDIRNLSLLLDEVERIGLWCVPQVGPWIEPGLSGAGIPGWLWRENAVSVSEAGYGDSFLRHLNEWWQHLGAVLNGRDNVLGTVLNPSLLSSQDGTDSVLTQIMVLAQNAGFAGPYGLWQHDGDAGSILWFDTDAVSVLAHWPVVTAVSSRNREDVLAALVNAATASPGGVVLKGVVSEHHWGWWYNPSSESTSVLTNDGFLHQRQTGMQAEIALPVLKAGVELEQASAVAPGARLQAWHTNDGTGIYVRNRREWQIFPRLVIPLGESTLVTEEVPLEPEESKLLFADMALRGGRLIYSTLGVVLRTEVAGRELLVFHNTLGGEVRLSDDFRVRHSKGNTYVERLTQDDGKQLSIRFDIGKVSSLLLDAPEGPLQLLAVNGHLAERLWHLDDAWRDVSLPSSPWALKTDDPARGIVLGPEYVVPDDKGAFSYLVKGQDYGYRWGPWKGSNPNTWLAPLIWRSPESLRLPELEWSSVPGAPEVLPDYEDHHWRKIAPDADLSMESLGVDAGFVWYRGRFNGDSAYVDLAINHAADVFLNGKHIVSLNPAPDFSPPVVKRISLSRHLMQDENVLVVLTEAMGRMISNTSLQHHGLLHCALDAGQPIRWTYRAGLTGERQRQGVTGYADRALISDVPSASDIITWHYSRFELNIPQKVEISVFLELVDVPVKAYVYLNGQKIHRTMLNNGKTQRIPLPNAMLNAQGGNEVLIAQWTRGAKPGMGAARLLAGEKFGWQQV